jgi:hypothetical protein
MGLLQNLFQVVISGIQERPAVSIPAIRCTLRTGLARRSTDRVQYWVNLSRTSFLVRAVGVKDYRNIASLRWTAGF